MRFVKCWSQEKSAVHLAQVPCFCLLALGTDPSALCLGPARCRHPSPAPPWPQVKTRQLVFPCSVFTALGHIAGPFR